MSHFQTFSERKLKKYCYFESERNMVRVERSTLGFPRIFEDSSSSHATVCVTYIRLSQEATYRPALTLTLTVTLTLSFVRMTTKITNSLNSFFKFLLLPFNFSTQLIPLLNPFQVNVSYSLIYLAGKAGNEEPFSNFFLKYYITLFYILKYYKV